VKNFRKIKSILYVEDEQNAQKQLSRFLNRFCEKLHIANNGQEALDIYKNNEVALVISDINMPVMDGIELAYNIKKIDEDQAIIFTTAYNDVEFLQQAIKLQVSGYILKPVDLELLEKKIDEVILSKTWIEIEKEQKKEMETILETTKDGIAIIDTDTNFLYVNRSFIDMLGYSKEELYETSSIALGKDEEKEKALKNIKSVLTNGFSENYEKSYITKEGKEIYVSSNLVLMPDKQRLLLATRDITEQKEKQRLLDNYISIVDSNVLISTTNLHGEITYASEAFCELSDYTKEELLGSSHNIIRHPDMNPTVFKELWETINKDETWKGELKNRKKDGSYYWVSTTIAPVFDYKDRKIGYTAIRHDITDKKYIEMISRTDPLTELYNRRFFDEKANKVINSARRDNKIFSFLIMDIDHFKQYNDTFGHQMGDEVLKKVANCLKNSLRRADDYCFRLGGEEFAITFESDCINKVEEFTETIRKNIENLKIEHKNNSASRFVTISIGLLIIEPNLNKVIDIDEIYKLADKLLYKAKENGRNQIVSNLVK